MALIEARALLFDMDGLMVDSEPLWFEVEREFFRRRGGEWTEELAHACIGQGLANTLRVMSDLLGEELPYGPSRDELHAAFEAGVPSLRLQPGCLELLQAAHGGAALAVASSSSRRLVSAVIEALDVARYFGAVVSGSDVARLKPAPDVFLAAAERLGVPPSHCVVLEDSLAGVKAGRAAGMTTIAVPERGHERFAGEADHVVSSLFEARARLRW